MYVGRAGLLAPHNQGFAPECKSGRVSKYGYYPSQYFARVSTGMYGVIYPAPVAKSRVSGVGYRVCSYT